MTKPFFSPTQLAMLRRCPLQYYYRYVEGLKVPPGISLLRGIAVHDAAEKNLRHKMSTGGLLPKDTVADIARDSFEAQWQKEPPMLDDDEKERGVDAVRGEAVDASVRLAVVHHEQLAPTIEPEHIERGFKIEIEDGPYDLLGYLDLQEALPEENERGEEVAWHRVRDLKTSRKSPAADAAAKSDQLTCYSLAVAVLDGETPRELAIDTLVDLKKEPKVVTQLTRRSDVDHQRLLDLVARAGKVVAAGNFLPADEGSWVCSSRWCGYYDSICPHGARGRSKPESWSL